MMSPVLDRLLTLDQAEQLGLALRLFTDDANAFRDASRVPGLSAGKIAQLAHQVDCLARPMQERRRHIGNTDRGRRRLTVLADSEPERTRCVIRRRVGS
ncbi:hypothetical protein [Methylorubrum zatmanii]|uniref:HTH lysR-type domain-containing protein n=1 Tax=Methylorubrum zatmanii TaxID=29429 RepID=A0ABW1WLX8_9HYPH|nr:hypothetical protein [Methylorubrum zatmanii]